MLCRSCACNDSVASYVYAGQIARAYFVGEKFREVGGWVGGWACVCVVWCLCECELYRVGWMPM